jgi:small-conductance mechanosensitive channel
MTRADNSHHLRRAAAARNVAAHDRTRAVIEDLDRRGQAVTFVAVAQAAGVSRSWLYNQTDLNDSIAALRRAGTHPDIATPPFAQRATTDSLRQRLDSAREDITRLRSDNATLRDQLARSLGQQRLSR